MKYHRLKKKYLYRYMYILLT